MNLPIDASTPCREKYLDETPMLAGWFVFGTSEDGSHVDLSDGNDDVMVKVPIAKAHRILVARDAFCKAIREELALK